MHAAILRRLCLPLLFIFLSPSTHAYPVIQEVYYDQPSYDGSEVFTELYGSAGFDLTGWSLLGINGNDNSIYRTLDLTGAIIPADGLLLISTASASTLLASISDWTANVDWQNGPDSVQLLDDTGTVIDAIQYGITAFTSQGEGAPAEEADSGLSLSRLWAAYDSGDNKKDFIAGTPSPGSVSPAPKIGLNSSTVAIGPSWTLWLLGLSLFIFRHKKARISGLRNLE